MGVTETVFVFEFGKFGRELEPQNLFVSISETPRFRIEPITLTPPILHPSNNCKRPNLFLKPVRSIFAGESSRTPNSRNSVIPERLLPNFANFRKFLVLNCRLLLIILLKTAFYKSRLFVFLELISSILLELFPSPSSFVLVRIGALEQKRPPSPSPGGGPGTPSGGTHIPPAHPLAPA